MKPALALVALAACGPSFSTPLGAPVLVDPSTPFTSDEAAVTESWAVDLFTSMGYDHAAVSACAGRAQVHVEPLDCGDCGGFQISGEPDLFVESRQACGWDVAAGYAHELAHWLQDCLGDPWAPDAGHQEEAVWWHGMSTFRHTCAE
jgi:hypothetical protein